MIRARASTFGSVLSLIFLLASCNKMDEGTTPESQVPMLGVNQFPVTAGLEWTYDVYDSLTNTRDTVTVSVIADAPGAPLRARWVYVGRSHNDTVYVAVAGDSVLLFDEPNSKNPSTIFLFPLVDGSSWGTQADMTVVHLETGVPSRIGTLAHAFSVERWARGLNYILESDVLVASGIGIVRWEKKVVDFGPTVHERWDLIGYKREG